MIRVLWKFVACGVGETVEEDCGVRVGVAVRVGVGVVEGVLVGEDVGLAEGEGLDVGLGEGLGEVSWMVWLRYIRMPPEGYTEVQLIWGLPPASRAIEVSSPMISTPSGVKV
jgi:hypothetical protein